MWCYGLVVVFGVTREGGLFFFCLCVVCAVGVMFLGFFLVSFFFSLVIFCS